MRRALLLLALLTVAACETTEPEPPDIGGLYTYAGTVNGFPAADIFGTVHFTQTGARVLIVHNLQLRNNGVTSGTVTTQQPGETTVGLDGAVSWAANVSGTTFRNDGMFKNDRITGTWTWTGQGLALAGNFTATR